MLWSALQERRADRSASSLDRVSSTRCTSRIATAIRSTSKAALALTNCGRRARDRRHRRDSSRCCATIRPDGAVDSDLRLRGQSGIPRVTGRVTVNGGDVAVDTILDRAVFRLYSTQEAVVATVEDDAIVALNPWDRLRLEIALHVPNTLRLIGDNVQVTPGTPIGLGNINLRVLGDLFLYKDPGGQLDITGSLDQVTGTYAFQGRRFDLDPASSINFHGDLNPELFVSRDARDLRRRDARHDRRRAAVAGVAARQRPAARSVGHPVADRLQHHDQRAVGAPAGAARGPGRHAGGRLHRCPDDVGPRARRSVSARSRSNRRPDNRGGTRVTIGDELAPGLVARFSRQFGADEYDEATIEYDLSHILRIRATFSDASELTQSPFRRVERAGIDFLVFFSF